MISSKMHLMRQNNLLTSMLAKRSMHSVAGKNYVVPDGEGINDIIEHLDKLRPTYTLLYFTAAWNPMCKKIE